MREKDYRQKEYIRLRIAPIIRGREESRKTTRKTINKDLELNGPFVFIIYDRTQWGV